MKECFTVTTVTVVCANEKQLKTAEEIARKMADPENVTMRTMISYPGGVENRRVTSHRTADYFSKIEVKREKKSAQDKTFPLTITFLPLTDRYWKDLVVRMMLQIQEETQAVISINTKVKC